VTRPADLDAILRPRSIAVLGASRREGSIGRAILRNLLQSGFQGPVYPVHPKADHVLSIRAWPSVEDIPDPVDLAVVSVPARFVLSVVEACGRKGVGGLVVITAGFREIGEAGRALEAQIVAVARKYKMRMVGPNCMGVLNTDPSVSMNASFGGTPPLPGNAAFASQSGALGEVVLATAKAVGLGMSQFVSLGNKADVSGNDLLSYWGEDEQTRVILLYLESFGNPRHFPRIAREVTRKRGKPILAVKSGRSRQGAAAASSHTGSLAGGDQAASALFRSCGVIRCDTVWELFDVARGFASQPLPKGKRVAVLTNAGGPGIMATDAIVHFGLDMAELSDATTAALRAVLPVEASVNNPVDMIASANAEQYRVCSEILLRDPSVDALLAIFVTPIITDPVAIAEATVAGVAAAETHKPVTACFMGRVEDGDRTVRTLRDAGIPNYMFPDAAARTLSAMHRFSEYRTRPEGNQVLFEDVDRAAAAQVIATARAEGRAWLSADASMDLLNAYGIPTVPGQAIKTPEAAIAFAEQHGYPVVLKIDSEKVVHKSDVGGVKINLRSAGEIKGAFWDLRESLSALNIPGFDLADADFLVQRMITGGQETIIGAVADATAGHLLMFGLGGVFVELMKDVAFAVHPLTDVDAERMMREIRGWPLLAGHRGSEPLDTALLRNVLLRLDQLIEDFPEIAEMDLNPFMAAPKGQGSVAVDARVLLAPLAE
jgi:acetyl coenzyme A synthetase (ADP forming)-like protein